MPRVYKEILGFFERCLCSDFITSNIQDEKRIWTGQGKAAPNDYQIPLLFRLMSVQLAVVACCLSLITIIGYYYGITYLYRPIEGGPATNPITSHLCLLIGLFLLLPSQQRYFSFLRRILIFTVSSVTIFVLLEHLLSVKLVPAGLLFEAVVTQEVNEGLSNYLSLNTDFMLLLIAGSQFAECIRRYMISQLFAFFAIAIPCLSFIGYLYGIDSFYSHMSLYTAILGFMLGWSSLARTADKAGLRAILNPFFGGTVARIQVLAGMVLPFLVGFLLLPYSQQTDKAFVAVLVLFLTWFMVLMLCVSAIVQEQVELVRQQTTDELIKAATTDSLTGLLNRKRFFELIEPEYKKALRADNELALLMIDVDNFKKINDLEGHIVGDTVLKKIAEAISESVRETDLVCRFGGEEFVVLLFDTSEGGTKRVCKKILSSVQTLIIPGWTETYGQVTVSIGASSLTKTKKLDTSIKDADKAMYEAKHAGKNQVCYQF